MKRGIVLAGFSALFLTICLFGSPIATARTPFDGAWSVLIITDRGTCDRAYRYALRIADGLVYYDDPSFSVSGGVDGAGRVRVGVSAGGQSANGYAIGQLRSGLLERSLLDLAMLRTLGSRTPRLESGTGEPAPACAKPC